MHINTMRAAVEWGAAAPHGRKWRFSDVFAASDFYFHGRLIHI